MVDTPLCLAGRANLDFGRGFYLTAIRQQAADWAKRVAGTDKTPILNVYELDRNAFIQEGRARIFEAYDEAWLQFIVENRTGREAWRAYDYIEGGVANDRVVDTVNLFIAGLMSLDVALERLSWHRPNNQICLLNQQLTSKHLTFTGYEQL